MLELEQALEALLGALPSPEDTSAGEVALDAAVGLYLSSPWFSPLDLPPFDNSAMDGWAVRVEDVQSVPARLTIQGRVAAGQTHSAPLRPRHAIRVFTGSPLPTGADAVVMQEDAHVVDPATVEIREPARPWEFVRMAGEDVRRGAELLATGTRMGPAQLALLAATGCTRVRVHRRVRVAILPNGSELIPPGENLPPGKVYESNALALASLVAQVGACPIRLPPPPDELPALTTSLEHAFDQAEVVITAGGASVGDHDLVKPAFESLGGRLEFWKVALKPGKPFFFGRLPRPGRPDGFLFGVPGNPVSAFVTTVLLVLPALRKLLGAPKWTTPNLPGTLAEPLSNSGGRRHFIRVQRDLQGSVRPSGPQASHLLGSLAAANGLVDVPPNTRLPAGTSVRVWTWD